MSQDQVIRAWKDPQYRASLGAELREMPAHPAGVIELTDEELVEMSGGAITIVTTSSKLCIAATIAVATILLTPEPVE